MDRELILQKFKTLNLWQKGGKRAPHKPLLVLYAIGKLFDVRLRHQPVALEAAHIKWRQAGGPDTEVNGLALCVLHHKLFDRGAFMLSKELEIFVSDDAHGSVGFDE